MGNCGECCGPEPVLAQQEVFYPTRPEPEPHVFVPPPPIVEQRRQTLGEFRNRVRRVSPLDYVIPWNGRTAEIDGYSYDVNEVTAEYNAVNFNENSAIDDLVWKQPYINAAYYNVSFERVGNGIKGTSKIFTPKSN